MKKNKEIIDYIKHYTVFEWLVYIKKLENMTNDDFIKYESNDLERNLLQNYNWYLIILDLSIRFSDHHKTIVKFRHLPTKYNYRKFISLYINSKDNESNFPKDLDFSLHIAMSRYGHEQLKRYAPMLNDLCRVVDLYNVKEPLLKQFIGLTPKQIFYFVILNNAKHDIFEPFDFDNMFRLLRAYDSALKPEKLWRFLSIFSISIKDYRNKCKTFGYTKETIKNRRLIEQYPIIDLGNKHYFIPSINALIEALTYRIFDTLCELQVNEHNFKRSFGDTFEDYTRRMTKYSHNEHFFECDDIIFEDKKKKAEYYLLKDNTTIVIESKLLPVNENIILNGQLQELEKEFIETVSDALRQIGSCFNNIDADKKIGIIVIHTHTLMLEHYLELIKPKLNCDFIDDVVIMSIIDFEILIHNDFKKIVEYFSQENYFNRQQLPLFFNQHNSYLKNVFNNILDEINSNINSYN